MENEKKNSENEKIYEKWKVSMIFVGFILFEIKD